MKRTKIALGLWALLSLFAGAALGNITVQSPVAGTTVASPVTIAAVDPEATAMAVYVDQSLVLKTSAKAITANPALSDGLHNITVQSWTNGVLNDKVSFAITVSSPQYSNVIKNLQQTVPWSNCGSTCGNSAGNNSPAYGTMKAVSSPSLSGKAAEFAITGKTSYTNYYWYLKTYTITTVTKAQIKYNLYVPSAYDRAPQALEFEIQNRHGNYVYDMAMQMGYASGYWKTFDKVNRKWVSTGVPFVPWTPDTWHEVIAEFSTDYTHRTYTLVDFYVDGVRKVPVKTVTFPALYNSGVDYLTYASFQEDMNSNPTPYHVYVDNYTLSWE